MRQCLTGRACLRAVQRRRDSPRLRCVIRPLQVSGNRHFATSRPVASDGLKSSLGLPFPEKAKRQDPAAWAVLLDHGLPSHLRQDGQARAETSLGAGDIAEILLNAHRAQTKEGNLDLLCHLGIQEGRWSAVVWLVKQLVEAFGPAHSKAGRLSQTVNTWTPDQSLSEITREPIDVQETNGSRIHTSLSAANVGTLDELTADAWPEKYSRESIYWRDTLGLIWRSLGMMTIACAGGGIRPEILEIIAYLHHAEVMPISIYNSRPTLDSTAIQQPPMLQLFSSRILTSLSDAAWRAHEKLIVEGAKARGGEQLPLRPEIPGTAFRVHVAGLQPEVWLELILWSCLHGGWITEGTAILSAIYSEPSKNLWSVLSWKSLIPFDERSKEWNELEYFFQTRKSSALLDAHSEKLNSVRRTVSSEVVNAYVDALISTMRLGVGDRGTAPRTVLNELAMLHRFLARSGLSLGAGSWDAVILRVVDAVDAIVHQRGNFEFLITLSPSLADELTSDNVETLPAYVLDGSAAVFGLFHRALRSRIANGDIKGAFRLFESLQALADKNKLRSVVDFLSKRSPLEEDRDGALTNMFTNNFSGIEYPAFNVEIPATIIGPFMELIMDAKAYDFGKWLLYSDEIDGPVISEERYGDLAVTPALVRFAAETSDTALLSRLVKSRTVYGEAEGRPMLPRNVLQSFFDSQVNLKRWDPAERLLQHVKETRYSYWNHVNVAHVLRVMLFQVRGAALGDEKSIEDLARAKGLLSDIVTGKYDREGERTEIVQQQIALLLTMLSTLDYSWAQYSMNIQPLGGVYSFEVKAKAFNLVLEGAVDAYGSAEGRRLLGLFWSHSLRDAQKIEKKQSMSNRMSRYAPSVVDNVERQRTVILIPDWPLPKVVIYGGLQPDLMTIQIIFRKAVDELKQGKQVGERNSEIISSRSLTDVSASQGTDTERTLDLSPAGMVVWAARSWHSLGMAKEDIKDELSRAIPEREVEAIQDRLPEFYDTTDNEQSTNSEEDLEDNRRGSEDEVAYRPF